jgi:hypothetical protein
VGSAFLINDAAENDGLVLNTCTNSLDLACSLGAVKHIQFFEDLFKVVFDDEDADI